VSSTEIIFLISYVSWTFHKRGPGFVIIYVWSVHTVKKIIVYIQEVSPYTCSNFGFVYSFFCRYQIFLLVCNLHVVYVLKIVPAHFYLHLVPNLLEFLFDFWVKSYYRIIELYGFKLSNSGIRILNQCKLVYLITTLVFVRPWQGHKQLRTRYWAHTSK
jgi:hypothetical protein